MNCKEVHHKIIQYLDGDMDEETRILFMFHLRSCSSCERLLNEIDATYILYNKRDNLKADPFMFSQITQEIENRRSTNSISFNYLPILRPIAAAAVLVIGIYLGIGLGEQYVAEGNNIALTDIQLMEDEFLFNDISFESIESFLLND